MYDACERTTSRSRIALARKALTISSLCADAYNLLADEAKTPKEARISTSLASKPENWR